MDKLYGSSSVRRLLVLSISIVISMIALASCSQGPPPTTQAPTSLALVESTGEASEMSEDLPRNEPSYVGDSEPAPDAPDAETLSFSPAFEVQEATRRATSVKLIVCYDIPSSDKDWILGRLPGDVFLSDGSNQVDLLSFTLVSLDSPPDWSSPRRCDRFEASVPEGFSGTEVRLTVKRIAASMPEEVDWDTVIQRVREAEPGVVFEPMLDQSGPSFALVQTPPGISDLEAHYLIMGMVDPVILGPWVIPVQFDS